MAATSKRSPRKVCQKTTELQNVALSNECLMDGFLALYDECTNDNLLKKRAVSSFVKKFNSAVSCSKRKRKKASDFEVKAIIGRGHFGEVQVVREKSTDAVFAMKVLRKSDLLAQPEISCFEEERDIMGTSLSPWITELHYAFQDSINLYLVMDFHAGGDLLSLLSRHDDIFEEDMAKFYIAEMAIAINSLHEMGYLHRDIKPENILLDCTGHIKLADFGSAAKLNEEKMVSSHMPVGTPDYVAPELLLSMNKVKQQITYGPEVDWWSLGICAYEMLFGATPFTNDHGSMVSTYANIMNFKNILKFPAESNVSDKAKDLIEKLLTDSKSRLSWFEIKAHPFFQGMNWDTIREVEAPYVPSIHGLDDTSHFDEVEQVKRQPNVEALLPQRDFSGKDLPFVGFTFSKDCERTGSKFMGSPTSSSSSESDLNNSNLLNKGCLADQSSSSASLADMDKLTLEILAEKDQEIEKLRRLLHLDDGNIIPAEARCISLIEKWNSMDSEIRIIEDELLEVKMEEMKAEIILLETEQEKLSSQLRAKEHHLAKTIEALNDANTKLQNTQKMMDREKRKSREAHHKDFMLLELRNESWESLLQSKQATIDELSARLRDLEELVEAYEDSEEKQATEVHQLQQKLNTSLQDLSTFTLTNVRMSGGTGEAEVELDNLHHAMCPSKKKITLHVTLKAGRCSFSDNKTLIKLQALQKMVDKYAESARDWREKEEELNAKINSLESDNHTLKQKEGMGRKMKDSLMEKVTSYQLEVEAQKAIIKELQETMRSYLNKSSNYSDSDRKLKEVQQSKLDLESELMSVKEESEKIRLSALHKTKQMEDAIKKLEEQRALAENYKNRYDCQVELTEVKVRSLEDELAKVTSDRQRLERREATLTTQVETLQSLLDDRTLEMEKLERRNTDIQTHLQQLQQRNTDLQVQIESLQKVSSKNDAQEKSKAELGFQVSHLQQQNADLERRITTALREKQGLEDKVTMSERDKERLMRRIERLETSEKDRHELESRVEKMTTLEREKRRLEIKVERLNTLEKEKLNLEEKLEKLQMDLRKDSITIESLTVIKKDLENKIKSIQSQKSTDSTEEVAQMKVKVAMLDMTEKEKARLETQVAKLKAEMEEAEQSSAKEKLIIEKLKEEKVVLEKEKERIQKENINLEKQKASLLKEKLSIEKALEALKNDKIICDEQLVKLNKEVDRLESSLSKLREQNKAEDESKKECDWRDKRSNVIATRQSGELKFEKMQQDVKIKELTTERDALQKSNLRASKLAEELKLEKLQLEKKINELKGEKEALQSQVNSLIKTNANSVESSQLAAQIKDLQQQLEETKREMEINKGANERSNFQRSNAIASRQSGELKFEKMQQDVKIKELTAERDALQKSNVMASKHAEELKLEKLQLEKKINELKGEKEALQSQVNSLMKSDANSVGSNQLEAQIKDLQQQLEEAKREMEIRKGANEVSGGDIPSYLRHELEESNLSLSEARSLLAASKRQELELRDRIDKLQRILDNKAVENARYLQNYQDAIAELKTLKSQHDTLQRQYKVLEDKHGGLQRERGSNSTETVRLMEQIGSKQQQYEMEHKKVEQLTKVCTELEDQIKDMEEIIEESKKREAEWEMIKKTYERAVDEREDELEGATQQIQAITMARSAASEKMSSMKQQVESIKALHMADVEKLNHSLREERAKVVKLSQKLAEVEDKEKSTVQVFDSQMREMDKSNQEKMKLKEELAQVLSDNCSLRKENLKLKRHLDEAMDKFEMIIGEKVNLENFTEALQGLHFLNKYKFESTIGQQMKLIDYLQDLYMEHTGKKKKSKFFGPKSGSKEALNKAATLPLSWTDLQTALEQERSKTNILQEQVDRLREENFQQANELLKLKQPGKIQANVTVKLTNSAMNALTHSPASQQGELASAYSSTSLASTGSSSSSGSSTQSRSSRSPHSSQRRAFTPDPRGSRVGDSLPTPQRMHHNIPHRFATGLNTRAAKCGLCLGTVHFVRQASKCQECGMVVHPKCASSVPATCGLPTEYVRHFALVMSQIYRGETGRGSDIDNSRVKMEGWLKVPRVGKSGWENRYCVLEGTWLTLYMDDRDENPVDSFDLNPIDADVGVHSAVTSAELSNTASSDLHYVLRIDQDPLTTCWPGRYLYLMTTNFQEKQRWVASLEAVVKSAQCKSDLYRNRSQTITVMSLKDDERRDFNCTLVISSQLVLVGTDDGLYAFNPQALTSKRKQMTQLTGFGSVHQMALAKGVDLILVLTGPERRLVMLENKLVKCRMSQTLGGETTPFSFKTIDGLQCCTIFDVGLWNNASYLCVGTPTKVYLMKYNPSLAMYCVRKEFPSSEPCSCVCIAENYAIVGTERFYKINIEHPSLLDFVDRQDSSLAFAAFGAANHHSFPLAVVRVSPENLPLEFLLCFHEFGVFVDHHGQRSRATDVKWSGLPLTFAFVEPFLYVIYTNTIHATVVPTDRTQAKGRQTVIDIQSPRYLGPAPGPGCVYISSSNTNIMEIICVRGQEDFSTDSNKENSGIVKIPTSKQVHFFSPKKTLQFNKEGSLASLSSNTSAGTVLSVESDV